MSTTHRNHRRILVAVAAVALVAAAAGAYAVATGGLKGLHERRAQLMHDHIQLRVERALVKVDATDQQKQQVLAILERAFGELKALHADHEGMHARAAAILTAPTVDRQAIEAMRVEHLAKAEQASRIIAAALADAADVLGQEQRQKLAAAIHDCIK